MCYNTLVSRPTKYGKETLLKAQRYVTDCRKDNVTPFIEELAFELDINDDTINEWTKKHDEFSATIRRLKMLQRLCIKRGGLEKKMQSNMAIFLLKTNHEEVDTDINVTVTYVDPEPRADEVIAKISNEQQTR